MAGDFFESFKRLAVDGLADIVRVGFRGGATGLTSMPIRFEWRLVEPRGFEPLTS